MDAYVYQAALYCKECGEKIKQELDANGCTPNDVENESSYDSDLYPKGPYPDGGGESDCPNHCDNCNVFLENPLTRDGENYVRDSTVQQWREYYSYLFQ